ncbi:MAG: hypothetical protein ACR2HT_00680 [Pyrinomonadaceae bacterium]
MYRISIILFVLLFTDFTIQAQTSPKKPVKQCNANLVRQLVEQQAVESKSMADTDKRIKVLIRVADFLWVTDEETARRYFAEAFQVAREKSREKYVEKSSGSPFLGVQKPNYPFEVIRAVAKRDAEWTKKLTETALKDSEEIIKQEKEKADSVARDPNISEITGLAISLAEQNPAAALYFARRAMRAPLQGNWFYALYQIAGKNRQLADQIYAELINTYTNAEVSRLLYLSAYPFARERIMGVEKYQMGAWMPENFTPNVNLQKQFLNVFLRRVMTLTPESASLKINSNSPQTAFAVMALNEIEPMVAQQFPEFAEPFQKAKATAQALASPEVQEIVKNREDSQKSFSRTFAERMEDLEKADEEGKLTDMPIVNLVTNAKKEEDFEIAETWLNKIRDEKVRETATNYFYFSRSKLATKENRFDDARKHAEKVSKIEHRAVLYFDVAEARLKEPTTRINSLDTLFEVYQMAQKAPETVEKAQVLLGLAYMYEKIDHSNALDTLSNSIKTANKLENPDLFTSFMSHQIIGKDFAVFIGYDVPGFNISETFGEISKADFQNSVQQAEGFTDKYLRTLAILASVKDCENEKPIKTKPKAKIK